MDAALRRIGSRTGMTVPGVSVGSPIAAGSLSLGVNDNRRLDKSVIGTPKVPLGLSNSYRPKGPPNFQRASFWIEAGETLSLEIELYKVLGKSGQWGLGIGAIGRGSPYVDSDSSVLRVIPAITYFGERLQWVGPGTALRARGQR